MCDSEKFNSQARVPLDGWIILDQEIPDRNNRIRGYQTELV